MSSNAAMVRFIAKDHLSGAKIASTDQSRQNHRKHTDVQLCFRKEVDARVNVRMMSTVRGIRLTIGSAQTGSLKEVIK